VCDACTVHQRQRATQHCRRSERSSARPSPGPPEAPRVARRLPGHPTHGRAHDRPPHAAHARRAPGPGARSGKGCRRLPPPRRCRQPGAARYSRRVLSTQRMDRGWRLRTPEGPAAPALGVPGSIEPSPSILRQFDDPSSSGREPRLSRRPAESQPPEHPTRHQPPSEPGPHPCPLPCIGRRDAARQLGPRGRHRDGPERYRRISTAPADTARDGPASSRLSHHLSVAEWIHFNAAISIPTGLTRGDSLIADSDRTSLSPSGSLRSTIHNTSS